MKDCSVEYALDLLTGKWQMHILWCLCQAEIIRFNELKRKLPGISNNALAKSLRELEENYICLFGEYEKISVNKILL